MQTKLGAKDTVVVRVANRSIRETNGTYKKIPRRSSDDTRALIIYKSQPPVASPAAPDEPLPSSAADTVADEPEGGGCAEGEDGASTVADCGGGGSSAAATAGVLEAPAESGPVRLPAVPVNTWLVVFGFLRSADFACSTQSPQTGAHVLP